MKPEITIKELKMKNRKHTIYIMVILTFGLLVGSLAAKEYQVKYFNGVVEVKKAGQADWQQATLEMKVTEGDSIRTREESMVELQTADGRSFKIGEVKTTAVSETLTNLALIKREDKKDSFLDRLRKLSGSQAGFQVTSPTAVAAIRGKAASGFDFVDVNGDGVDDNMIEDDLSGLTGTSLGVNEKIIFDTYQRESRGRHGIHDDTRRTHWDSEHFHGANPNIQ